jgi:lipid-A-disaccharide synthase
MAGENKVVVITGEASGEAHAARMIAELKRLSPNTEVAGIGGENMRAAGAEIVVDFSELAVMGIVEVLKRYSHIKKIFKQIVKYLQQEKPSLLVLVDYPGFNLKLAKVAKKLNIPVLYYISPKVWAWRKGRIKTIKRYVDHMAVLFPFEVPIYEQKGVDVSCVGHPLVDAVQSSLTTEQAKRKFEFNPEHRLVGLFAGSRKSEVTALLPVMLETAEKIHARHLDTAFVLPLAQGLTMETVEPILKQTKLPIKLIRGDFYDVTKACDAIIAASGTVTLEIALLAVPHFIVYKVAPTTYNILKRLVKIPYVGLCNIVTGEPVIKEILQDDVTVENLDQALTQLLTDRQSKHKAELIQQQVLTALGPSGGANNAAEQVLAMVNQQ